MTLERMTTMQDFEFEVLHVGINAENKEEALKAAELLKKLFGFAAKETPVSFFSTDRIEIMKSGGRGKCGHVAVGTRDAAAAKKYLEEKGVEFDEGSAAYLEDGRLKLVYLKNDVAGFAFHLIQK